MQADTIPIRPVAATPAPPDSNPPAAPTPLVADARRLAVLMQCGIRTIRTWDAGGKIPAPIRVGGRVVWRLDEIRDWLNAGAPDRTTWAAIRSARKN